MQYTSYFFLPNISLFGPGCMNEIGAQARRLGVRRYLIITDDFLAKSGLAGRMQKLLGEAGITTGLFTGVMPNPTLHSVNEAFAQYEREDCGGVISIGGGSAHDCGKAVCILATNPGPLSQYAGTDLFRNRSAPMIAVNTTAGTASEITNCFIITDTETSTKLIFEGVNALADVAVNDPELMRTLPRGMTATTGMDALTHAVECYVSNLSFYLTDELAKVAVKTIFESLSIAVAEPGNLEARERMAYGQYIAGMAFGNGGVGLVHAIAHQLGGVYDLPHGLCNAVLLPHVIRFNSSHTAERYAQLYALLRPAQAVKIGEVEAAKEFAMLVESLSEHIGTRKQLRELGVHREDFALLARKTLQDSCSTTNPILPTEAQIIEILEKAY